jgi:hypothetical protein
MVSLFKLIIDKFQYNLVYITYVLNFFSFSFVCLYLYFINHLHRFEDLPNNMTILKINHQGN